MNLDVFTGDAFRLLPLSQAVTNLPYIPTVIRDMRLFTESGIRSTDVGLEMVSGVVTLVPTAPRGGPAVVKGVPPRNVRKFSTVHLPQRTSLFADEVLQLRAFGSETETEVAMSRLLQKLAVCRQDNDITIEYQRVNALKGKIVDADGTTVLLDMFAEFGATQQKINMALDVTTTKVRSKCTAIKRAILGALGGVMYRDVVALCGSNFFDALIDHANVQQAFATTPEQMNVAVNDLRGGFRFGGITWVEYVGGIGATPFVETDNAYAVPMGVPGMFSTYYAPANHMDSVGSEGIPYYASLEPMDHGQGIEALVQSNPLHLVNRPAAIIKLGKDAASAA